MSMTENRAIAKRRYRINTASQLVGNGVDGKEFEDLEKAIQALEEIQQYRVIGTVQEVAKLSNSWTSVNYKLRQFEKIGTIEEFKALKGKSVAKKPKMIGYRKDGEAVYECGCCGSTLKVADQPFCMICSCKVDWQCKLPAN